MRKTLTVRFLYRTVLSLTVFSVGLAVFFIFGNIQRFLDSTQVMIMTILSFSATATVLATIPVIIPEFFLALMQRRHKYLQLFIVSLLCVVMTVVLAVLSRTILMLSRGL